MKFHLNKTWPERLPEMVMTAFMLCIVIYVAILWANAVGPANYHKARQELQKAQDEYYSIYPDRKCSAPYPYKREKGWLNECNS